MEYRTTNETSCRPQSTELRASSKAQLENLLSSNSSSLRRSFQLHSTDPCGPDTLSSDSTVAYMDLLNMKDESYTYTAEDWNPMTYEEAAAQPADGGGMVYSASKAIAEKFAWDFVKNNDVSFTLTTYVPFFASLSSRSDLN